MSKYNKFWVAAAAVVVAVLTQVYGGNNQTVRLVVEVLGAIGVYATPNQ